MRHAALLALPVVLATATAAAQPAPYYDTAPMMAAMRPVYRGNLAQLANVPRLDALPYYDLALTLDPSGARYTLREEVRFTNTARAPLRELVFRVYGNATRREGNAPAPVTFRSGSCDGATCTVRAESPSVIVVRPSRPIAPNGRLTVRMELDAALPQIAANRTTIMAQGMESMSALGSSEGAGDYGLLARGDNITSLANFYPVLARRTGSQWLRTDSGSVGDFGSDDLSNVHAVIDAPEAWVVAASGTAVRADAANGRRRHEVMAPAVRDFAVMAGPTLRVSTRRVNDVEVRSIYLPEHQLAGTQALDVAAASLAVFEQRFGPYPYVDLDVVEAPLVGGAGGVEFSGLVTVASMFYRGVTDAQSRGGSNNGGGLGGLLGGLSGLGSLGDPSAVLGQMLPSMLEFVTAHEVAHQYWHGLVGSDSRDHPFIDESLAQWSAAYYIESRYGAERARRDADMQVRMNYQFMRMMNHADGAVDRPASAFSNPVVYAGLVYGKGPYLYNALREAAGDDAFFRAVRRYVDAWRFRVAPANGFVDALAAETPANASRYRALARRWLRETHGDQDLGQLDMGSLIGNMLGGNANLPPETREILQHLGPLLQGGGNGGGGLGQILQGLQRQGGGNGNHPPARRQGQGQGEPSQQELQQLLQQALEGLGGM